MLLESILVLLIMWGRGRVNQNSAMKSYYHEGVCACVNCGRRGGGGYVTLDMQ